MISNLLNDVDMITFDLVCAIDNIAAVHTAMKEDGGANWQQMCNAVFSSYRQLCNIHDAFKLAIEQALEVEKSHKDPGKINKS